MAHLLIVDDESSICWGLAKLAESMGHSVTTAASAEQAFGAMAAQKPDAIVLDVRLPGMSGLEAVEHFRRLAGNVPIVIITAFGDLETAVEAVRQGAFEYLLKPFDLSAAQRVIQRAVECALQPPSPLAPPQDLGEKPIVGHSAAIQDVFKRIAVVAPSDACVHLHGESGTGKELAARAIHRYSRRSEGPFVAVNVASLSPSLAESELFGHVRGAFTGAEQPRKGLLEQAHGGTIFLDEVADIPLPVQVKLLRVLEHGEILPVGAEQPVQSDFRLISATHQDLRRRVAEGEFRHDLYYRLITFEIEIPPLRRRREDIAELAAYFLDLLKGDKESGPAISHKTLEELQRRQWFGNVRELRNAMEHAMILSRGNTIEPEHLPPPLAASPEAGHDAGEAISAMVRRWAEAQLQNSTETDDLYERFLKCVEPPLLLAAMEHCGGQYMAAAKRLGLHRTTLRKKLKDLGLGDG